VDVDLLGRFLMHTDFPYCICYWTWTGLTCGSLTGRDVAGVYSTAPAALTTPES